MEKGDTYDLNTTKRLANLNNCRRVQFRITPTIREDLRKLVCRASYRVDGYSLHAVMRACLVYGLDALLRLELNVSVDELLVQLKDTKPKRGRPTGSCNKTVNWG